VAADTKRSVRAAPDETDPSSWRRPVDDLPTGSWPSSRFRQELKRFPSRTGKVRLITDRRCRAPNGTTEFCVPAEAAMSLDAAVGAAVNAAVVAALALDVAAAARPPTTRVRS